MSSRCRYLLTRGLIEKIAAIVLIGAFGPIMLVVAAIIRINMGTPVLFFQERIGRYGKPFKIVKFRTMVREAEHVADLCNPLEANLIPPLGKFLRKASLDELPQLFNILSGEMSFVGPRPMLPEVYKLCTVQQRRRVVVPQGITGLAQIRFRNNAPWSQRVQSDLQYVDLVSPALDLFILVHTLKKVLMSHDVRMDQRAEDVVDLTGGPLSDSGSSVE